MNQNVQWSAAREPRVEFQNLLYLFATLHSTHPSQDDIVHDAG
jgi:hypothetical protein